MILSNFPVNHFPYSHSLFERHKGINTFPPQLLVEERISFLLLSPFSFFYITSSPILIIFSLFSITMNIPWKYISFWFKLIMLKLHFWIWILTIKTITVLHIVIFVITLLDGGIYDTNIIMFLIMVFGYCLN